MLHPDERIAAVQKHTEFTEFAELTPSAAVEVARHGWRAKCLQRLIRLDLPVPKTVALPCDTVRAIAAGQMPDMTKLAKLFGASPLVSVRSSPAKTEWGGPGTVLNVGMNAEKHAELAAEHGVELADALYLGFVQSYAIHVARLDPDMFSAPPSPTALASALAAYESETDDEFPQSTARQLGEVLRSMARAWEGTTARLLREAKGAPADAALGLVVQDMALAVGPGLSGAGTIQLIEGVTGAPQVTGRFRGLNPAHPETAETLYLVRDKRGHSLEEAAPEVFAALKQHCAICRTRLREEMQVEFALENGALKVIDAVTVAKSSRAAVRVAVTLAKENIISRDEAILRVEPRAVSELLHYQVDPRGPRDRFARGIPASPGAATGRIVFTSAAAQASAARDERCVLVRRETAPEDIRGMHAAVAVLTERGGITSHAAVIARGLGLPCIVGASDISLNMRDRTLTAKDGRVFREGDVITVDGSNGEVLAGAAEMLEPALDEWFKTLLHWADNVRDIGVRANADTPDDARTARMFEAEGIGLCRTEHMFFDEDRLTVMREMIFADTAKDRKVALDRLLPMQRADFIALFDIMAGLPVCIRLFDPPLNEFLPQDRDGMRELAEALDRPLSEVTRRVESLREFNPMLGLRGVRVGISVPEIYDMQARAIFEATVEANRRGAPVVPEIMIPLVSAKREVEIVKTHIDAVAAAVKTEQGTDFDYRLGVMVETPRAALRAGDIAQHAAFLSFGTNDLTQMAYGLSRDDAGRFMGEYVRQGVYPEDPFHVLDTEGVGELLLIGSERGRRNHPEITISVCGEHGGNPESIKFCRQSGFDYVSCSPFRVPVARLAAAHFALLDPHREEKTV
ncbi:MAG: putative PEP-binding protein [Paracoccaceae bacterium]